MASWWLVRYMRYDPSISHKAARPSFIARVCWLIHEIFIVSLQRAWRDVVSVFIACLACLQTTTESEQQQQRVKNKEDFDDDDDDGI